MRRPVDVSRSSPVASVDVSGDMNESKHSLGILILMTSSLRRVCATAGLTSFFSAFLSGARNHELKHDTRWRSGSLGVALGVVAASRAAGKGPG